MSGAAATVKRRKTAAPSATRHVGAWELFALSSLRPTETGVEGAVLWIAAGEFALAEAHHGPRLMVVVGDSLAAETLTGAVSIHLTTPPEVLGSLLDKVARAAVQFVDKNRDVLLRHWSGELDSAAALALLGRITPSGR